MIDFIVNYILLFLILISALVVLHELGHYGAAKLLGIKTSAFALGMGPILFRKMDRSGTEWRICAFPIGGYVAFPSIENGTENPYERPTDKRKLAEFKKTIYGAHPIQKILIYVAGPLVNLLVAYLLYCVLIFVQGGMKYPLEVAEIASTPYVNELRSGDILLELNGMKVPTSDEEWFDFTPSTNSGNATEYKIIRESRELLVLGAPLYLARVGGMQPNSAALDAGMRVGDVITKVNGEKIVHFRDLAEVVQNSRGGLIRLEVWRNGSFVQTEIQPRVRPNSDSTGFYEQWMIGVASPALPFDFEVKSRDVGFFQSSLNASFALWYMIKSSLSGIKAIVIGAISTCNMTGPIGIAEMTGDVAKQGTFEVFSLVASISLALAIFNMLPIPPFDGFHIVFATANWVARERIPYSVMNAFTFAGVVLFAFLFLFISWQDIFCV